MAQAQDANSTRPLSPHLSIWRWHPTMAASIFHRVAGVGLYGGAMLLAVWLIMLAVGGETYALADVVLTSIIGQIALYLLIGVAGFHLFNGLRHFVWDVGAGFDPKQSSMTAVLAFLFGIVCALAAWAFVCFGGAS